MLYAVPYKQSDGDYWDEVYVVELNGKLYGYETAREAIKALGKVAWWNDPKISTFYIASVISGILMIAVVTMAFLAPENPTFDELVSLFTLTVGYIVGSHGAGRGQAGAE